MDELRSLLPLLTGQQIDALLCCARAMISQEPRQEEEEYLTVPKLHKRYKNISERSIYDAISDGRLKGKPPEGQTKPIHVKLSDFKKWAGLN